MTKPRRIAPKRKVGDWTALVDGVRLAVLQNLWWTKPGDYFDPMTDADRTGARYTSLIEALAANDTALMQISEGDGSSRSKGYVGMFRFKDLDVGDDGSVRLKIVERLPFVI